MAEVEGLQAALLTRISHELRTPLTSVVGFLELLTKRQVPAAVAHGWYPDMLASCKQLERVVELLEFTAGLDTTDLYLTNEPVEVVALVESEIATWRGLPGPVVIGRDRDRPVVIVGDRRWLQRSVHELVDNACKFSPSDGHVLVAIAEAARSGRDGVEIAVADSGRGMSATEATHAFGQFVQGDSSDTRQFGGLGLGLTLASRVVDAHGGWIGAVSAPGRGTTMTMWLPLAASEVALRIG